jgi:Transposase zinc-ribbon domain
MIELPREVLAGIRTVDQMVAAFQDEERCRQLLEAMVWPRGRLCPKCGYKNSIALAGAMWAGEPALASINARAADAGFSSR